MHVDRNMHVIGWNTHVTCTVFRIGVSTGMFILTVPNHTQVTAPPAKAPHN